MQKTMKGEHNPYRAAIRPLKRTLVVAGLFSAAINILMLTGPVYMLQVYDRVLASGSVATLQGLFLIVVVLYAFLGLYDFLRARLLSRASYRLDQAVAGRAFSFWLSGLHAPNRDDNPMRDLEIVRGFVGSPAIAALLDMPWIPLFVAIVFFIHPWLGWLTVAGASVVVIAAFANQLLTKRAIAEAMQLEAADRGFADRSRRNAEAVRALGMQDKVIRRWREMHERALARSQTSGERSEVFASFSKAFRLLLQSMLLTLGAYLAIQQEVSAGAIIATSIIAGRALAPVDQVIGQWRMIGRARTAHAQLLDTLDQVAPDKQNVSLPEPRGKLDVTKVSKLAPGAARPMDRARILMNVSFSLEPGDALCVIGNSAAGKSSLARLIVGAWTPDSGEVRLDGATLDQWKPEELGRHVGYLPQHFDMLPGTVAENIARFDPTASDAAVVEAARIAGVHEMILSLPDGYATQIGVPNQPLSGGQIQRVGLARAIYGIPRLVVLDEPNSNLDSQGDIALAEAIQTLRDRGSVVIVMAHRPSVIAAVNKVLVLQNGQVAQFGDRDDVLRHSAQRKAAAAVGTAAPAARPAAGTRAAVGARGEAPGRVKAIGRGDGAERAPARARAAAEARGSAGDRAEKAPLKLAGSNRVDVGPEQSAAATAVMRAAPGTEQRPTAVNQPALPAATVVPGSPATTATPAAPAVVAPAVATAAPAPAQATTAEAPSAHRTSVAQSLRLKLAERRQSRGEKTGS